MSITNSMDSVFDKNSKAELDFDIIFDEDDSLIDMVSESGILSASFDDLHQTQDNATPKDFGEAEDDACGAKNVEGTHKAEFEDGVNKGGKDYEGYYGKDPLETEISSGKVNEDFDIDAYMESDDSSEDDDTAGEDSEQDAFENESFELDSFMESDDFDDDDSFDDDEDVSEGGDIDCLLDPKNGETPEGCCRKGSKECDYEDYYGDDPLERRISSGKVQEGFDIDEYMMESDDEDTSDEDDDALDEAAGSKADDDDALINNVSKEKSSKKRSDLHYEYSDEDLIDAAINGEI